MTFSLVVLGPPRTKKTSNRLGWRYSKKLGKKVRVVLPSKAWARWTEHAMIRVGDIEQIMASVVMTRLGPITQGGPLPFLGLKPLTKANVRCRAIFYRDRNAGDAVGFYQGLADLLEKRTVLENDRQIVDWSGSELRKDAKCPRVELTLEVLDA